MNRGISWYGGKQYMVRHLLSLIPVHSTYVEPFGGGAALLLNKPPSPLEVYNDINPHLVNFFTVLREDFERLHRYLILTPYSREEHRYACDSYTNERLDRTERAALFWIATQQSLNGITGGAWARNRFYSRCGMAKKVSAWIGMLYRLPEIAQRLASVQIECSDFEEVFAKYDSPHAFFYLDPPYLHETRVSRKAYEYEMTEEDHIRMLEAIKCVTGRVLLSGYANDLYGRYLKDWNRLEFDAVTHSSLKSRSRRVEVLWLNYEV